MAAAELRLTQGCSPLSRHIPLPRQVQTPWPRGRVSPDSTARGTGEARVGPSPPRLTRSGPQTPGRAGLAPGPPPPLPPRGASRRRWREDWPAEPAERGLAPPSLPPAALLSPPPPRSQPF